MSQADNYTPISVTGTTATLDVVLPWTFDGIDELLITQTDGTTNVFFALNDFDAFVIGQTVTVENYFEVGNSTTITVARETKKTQEFTQLETNPLDSDALNSTLDKIVRMIQDSAFKADAISEDVLRGDISELLMTAITSDDPFDIPTKEFRQNVYMGFDSNGNLILTVPEGVTPPDGPLDPESFLTVVTDIKVVTGTSYTILDGDSGKFIIFTNVADVEVTSPDDVTLGHQAMYLKTGATNEITHITSGGAEHVNEFPVIASKQYAWYSHVVFENTGGNAAKYRFIGEIDTTDTNNIEPVSRTITISSGSTGSEIQALIDGAGKYLNAGVELKIVFEDDTIVITEALVISDFTGPGVLTIESLTPPNEVIGLPRPVNITNSNNPLPSEYNGPLDYDNEIEWVAHPANSCMLISGNTCSLIKIRGFSFSAKVFPMVIAANSAFIDITRNFFNQINAFTLAEYSDASSLKIDGGHASIANNKFTTDTNTNGMLLHGCQVTLAGSSGNGSYLVRGSNGVCVSWSPGDSFIPAINRYVIDGFWSEGPQIG